MVEEDPLASLRLTMQLAGRRAWVAWFRGPEYAVADLLQGLEEAADEPVVCIPTVFELSEVPAGSVVLAGIDERGATWLNAHRSAIQANQLRLVLWQPDSAAFSLRTIAPDLDSWIGTWGRFPDVLPEVVRSALRRGASTMAMVRGIPTPTLATALGEHTTLPTRKPMADPSLALPAGLVVYQPIETDWQLRRALRQLAWHGRTSGALFATSSSWQSGLPLVDATTLPWAEATERLRGAGVQDAARIAARLGCLAQAIDESVAAATSGGEAPATVSRPLDEVERSLWALPRNGDTAAQWLALLRDPSLIAEESPFVVAVCNQLLAADPAPAPEVSDALHALRIESLIADSQTSTVCPSAELPEALVPMLEAPDSLDRVICLVGWAHAAVVELWDGPSLTAVAVRMQELSTGTHSPERILAMWGGLRISSVRRAGVANTQLFGVLRSLLESTPDWLAAHPVLAYVARLSTETWGLQRPASPEFADAQLARLEEGVVDLWPRAWGQSAALAMLFNGSVRAPRAVFVARRAADALRAERVATDPALGFAEVALAACSFSAGDVASAQTGLGRLPWYAGDALAVAPTFVLWGYFTLATMLALQVQHAGAVTALAADLRRAFESRSGPNSASYVSAALLEGTMLLYLGHEQAAPLLKGLRQLVQQGDIRGASAETVDAFRTQLERVIALLPSDLSAGPVPGPRRSSQ